MNRHDATGRRITDELSGPGLGFAPWRRRVVAMRSVYGDPAYAAAQKELGADLARLKQELKVPAELPPTVFGNQPLK